ncbi:MAG: hypothetical protein ACFHWX_13170 [Bacteroidota bacterium]
MINKTLIFSIATNGYDQIFEGYLTSQKQYAERFGYEYKLFADHEKSGISASDSAWLKVPLIIKALEAGYEWIAFFDADCMLFEHTPDIKSVNTEDKCFYMAQDCRMEIPNTGVMIIRNHPQVVRLFRKILRYSDLPLKFLPRKHWALYEMGHVVHFSINQPFFEWLDQRWNDTINKYPDHYVLHAHGSYSKKDRSKQRPMTLFESLFFRFKKGLRVSRLKKSADYYWKWS